MSVSRRTAGVVAAVSSVALVTALLSGVPSSAAEGCYADTSHSGSSPGDAILINTAEDLQCLHDSPSDWGKSFMQTADIDMMGTTWTTGIGVSQESSFYGQYSGGGFEISNLTLTTGATSGSFGLFG